MSQHVVYFHVAPSAARASIREHGLDFRRGSSRWTHTYPAGNYLYSVEEDVQGYGMVAFAHERYDVWQVSPAGVLDLGPDQEVPGDQARHVTVHPVAPAHLTLLWADQEPHPDPLGWQRHAA